MKLFEAKSNKLIRRLEGHPGIIYTVAFAPDGRTVASGSGDKTIKLWDVKTGGLIYSLFGHTEIVNSVAFSADGSLLVSGSKDDSIKIWDMASRRLIRTIKGYSAGVGRLKSVSFSADAKLIVAASDVQVKIWDASNGKMVRAFKTTEPHTSGQMSWCCGSETQSAIFSPDGKLIVSIHEDGTIRVWNMKNDEPVRVIKGGYPDLSAVAISPNGKLIATGYNEGDSHIELRSIVTGRLVGSMKADSDYVQSVAFSPDGRMIASGHMADKIKVWDVTSRKLLREFKQPFSENDQVAFSPDSKSVVSGGENQNILLWNIETGNLVWSLIPIDWEAENRSREIARKNAEISARIRVEQERQIREADKMVAAWKNQITISFEHFGSPKNPLEQHMMESGERQESLSVQPPDESTGVWLRLRNNSTLPISFRTDSFYLPRKNCGTKRSNGTVAPGLCDWMEVSIQYQIAEADGKRVPFGVDMASVSILPPGSSVLFNVYRGHLQNGRVIHVHYNYLKENEQLKFDDYGSDRKVVFRSSDLPSKK